jgi:DnaJ domain
MAVKTVLSSAWLLLMPSILLFVATVPHHFCSALLVSTAVHPDKNTANDTDTTKQFQAISMAYQILQDETLRQEYDETGVIPDTNDNDADHHDDMTGSDAWKSYFDQIFGKVTTSKIDSFAATYKVYYFNWTTYRILKC